MIRFPYGLLLLICIISNVLTSAEPVELDDSEIEEKGPKCPSHIVGVQSYELDASEQELKNYIKEIGLSMGRILDEALIVWHLVLDSRLGSAAHKFVKLLNDNTADVLKTLDSLEPNNVDFALASIKSSLEANRKVLTEAGLPIKMIPQAVDTVWISIVAVLTGRKMNTNLAPVCEEN